MTFCTTLRNLQTLSESTQHLPDHLKAAWPGIPWRDIHGFRNILVHNYGCDRAVFGGTGNQCGCHAESGRRLRDRNRRITLTCADTNPDRACILSPPPNNQHPPFGGYSAPILKSSFLFDPAQTSQDGAWRHLLPQRHRSTPASPAGARQLIVPLHPYQCRKLKIAITDIAVSAHPISAGCQFLI